MENEKFWLEEPSILLRKDLIFNLIPKSDASVDSKLNAITRLITVVTLIGFFVTRSMKILASWAATIVALVIVHYVKSKNTKEEEQEGFEDGEAKFTHPTPENPFMNVMHDDVANNPNRPPAAPASNPEINEEIREAVKASLNPEIEEKLFESLGDNMAFDNSLRHFTPMANTKVVNDQMEFARFCYGNSKSCRDGEAEACSNHNYRHVRDN